MLATRRLADARRNGSGAQEEEEAGIPAADRRPICVDLDRALLRTNLAYETLVALGKQRPRLMLRLPGWLARGGRAALKAELARHTHIDGATLPLDEELLGRLRAAHARGRELALFSSLDQAIVEGVARRLGIFRTARGNLADRERKLEAMREAYGEDFDPVVDGVDGRGQSEEENGGAPSAAARGPLRLWTRALRLHQWAKNALIFVPVLLTGPLASVGDAVEAAFAFLAFGLLASAGYLVNDLLDLEADRHHATKRRRPFAAGELSIRAGLVAVPSMVLLAAAICLFLPAPFAAVAAAYLVITLAYSLHLKEQPLLDVIVLAGLFTIRVLAGAVLLDKPISYWLLTFAMFLFLSLALIKRCSELQAAGGGALKHRGYTQTDLALLVPLGLASAVAANVIFVTYLINEHLPSHVYRRPELLWLILPVLLWWTLRLWRVTLHGGMHEDPVFFALRDRVSLLQGGVVLLLLALAW